MGWSMVLNLVVYLGYMAVFTFYFSVDFIVLLLLLIIIIIGV